MDSAKKIELEKLLGELCNGTSTAQQEADLRQILLASDEAQQFYIDYLNTHADMVAFARQGIPALMSGTTDALSDNDISDMDSVQPPISLADETHLPKLESSPTRFPLTSMALWGTVACIGLVFASWWYGNPFVTSPAGNNSPAVAGAPADTENEKKSPLYIAQLVKFSGDVVWRNNTYPSEFLLRLRRGDRIDIETGVVEVEYYSGAVLTLKGPCSFVATGESSARLEEGRLTGKVSGGDFFVTTPTAKVIDLGTEFGVSIDAKNQTDVFVFDGKVEVVSDMVPKATKKSVMLTEGMTAKVDAEGSIGETDDFDVDGDTAFVRQNEVSLFGADGEISLVDLFSANSNVQSRLSGMIAPDSGEADQNPWLRDDGPGYRISNGYQKTQWHPFVDGVFIPAIVGEYSQSTSGGHTVDLPRTSGRTWGPIWSRRKIGRSNGDASVEDYWGTKTLDGVVKKLDTCKTGLIGMHANVGLSFDLNAIRKSGHQPRRLKVTVENLDNSLVKDPEWAEQWRFDADFQVFVDGKLSASRMNFARVDGAMELVVDLGPQARFLTLVSTDSGGPFENTEGFDHVVLMDPILELTD